jgi:hypothetical protein
MSSLNFLSSPLLTTVSTKKLEFGMEIPVEKYDVDCLDDLLFPVVLVDALTTRWILDLKIPLLHLSGYYQR